MLKIKLKRIGRKHQPHYRVVLSETNAPNKVIEFLGNYEPRLKKRNFNAERINYWMGKGAQVSDTAFNMFVKEHIIKGKKITNHSKKNTKKMETSPDSAKEIKEETKASGSESGETETKELKDAEKAKISAEIPGPESELKKEKEQPVERAE